MVNLSQFLYSHKQYNFIHRKFQTSSSIKQLIFPGTLRTGVSKKEPRMHFEIVSLLGSSCITLPLLLSLPPTGQDNGRPCQFLYQRKWVRTRNHNYSVPREQWFLKSYLVNFKNRIIAITAFSQGGSLPRKKKSSWQMPLLFPICASLS